MFRKKKQNDRFSEIIEAIKYLEATSKSVKDFPESIEKEIKKKFHVMSRSQLLIVQSELIATIESDKKVITSSPIIVASLAFALPLYITGLKDLLKEVSKTTSEVINSYIQVGGSVILSIIPLMFVLSILKNLKRSSSSSGHLFFLEKLVGQLIAERDIWDEAHKLAHIEYSSLLKNKQRRYI
ncbi:hypothetical protein HUB98_09120 [Paenibacillus barcinonensis]|uniref:Uncharacterized protein n=1 Tax=Paenibacillus barcinonensis TaxID=198119 RepID=A0A2V4VAI2_PAEBA|nr:hypothetical protein [Paenibacillus barcinonensis]PYE49841.1 hypothetical protein DFQ00_105345 [Paenibacillus barcinonensis]QKS56484.1 hypothetical protein HUB98_09120 [Paenibacillus barcinonensis]